MKKIVKLDVGSTVEFSDGEVCTITYINIKDKEVCYIEGVDHFEHLNVKNKLIAKFNNIPVEEIEEVRFVGYDDKVTLKIGDRISALKYANDEQIAAFLDVSNTCGHVIRFIDGDGFDLQGDCYWVNGKLYACEDIIIPTESDNSAVENNVVDNNEMVEFEPITKDNIHEVLKHNNITLPIDYSIFIDDHKIHISGKKEQALTFSVLFSNKNWLQHLEIEVGKLKPLPKFNFDSYLKSKMDGSIVSELFLEVSKSFNKKDKDTADKILTAYQILKELKGEDS